MALGKTGGRGDTSDTAPALLLFVWIAWAKEQGGKNVARYLDFVAEVAKSTEHSILEVRTPLDPMKPYLTSLGFEIEAVIYKKEIQ